MNGMDTVVKKVLFSINTGPLPNSLSGSIYDTNDPKPQFLSGNGLTATPLIQRNPFFVLPESLGRIIKKPEWNVVSRGSVWTSVVRQLASVSSLATMAYNNSPLLGVDISGLSCPWHRCFRLSSTTVCLFIIEQPKENPCI